MKLASIAAALLLALPLTSPAQTAPIPSADRVNGFEPKWWKEAVVYQIYPRSFKDSNGDGIGDLPGITSRLDYLQGLGVNVLWLSPHFDSPNTDNGYDIRDYRKVMREFGTMADFDTMLAAVKQRHMRLIIDLVVNHTSDEHRWFVESRKSKDNPYRDFYIWRPGKLTGTPAKPDSAGLPDPAVPPGLAPPNNYPSFFSGSAWKYDPPTQEFYLHLFAAKQPDLNWDNPRVRQEVYSLMRFWLDKGVDGFRMDVIPLISKQPGLPDLSPDQFKNLVTIFANGPHRDQYLQEMNREVLAKYDDMTVGEAIGISLAEEPLIIGAARHELNLVFNFDAIRSNRGAGYIERKLDLPELKAIYTDHARVLGTSSWDTVFLSNHDNPRLVSNFGDDRPQFRGPSAKLLETMILTLRGTPFLYQGDELGMTNYPFTRLDQFDDIEVKNAYKERVLSGRMSEAQFVAEAHRFGRDNSRTPMQWDSSPNAGFSSASAKPWLAINPNYTTINAAQELGDHTSIYEYTRRLIALRAQTPAFVYGDFKDLDPSHPQVFAYTRTLTAEGAAGRPAGQFLVVLNFSSTPITYTLPGNLKTGVLTLSNQPESSNLPTSASNNATTLHLAPWEARIYQQAI